MVKQKVLALRIKPMSRSPNPTDLLDPAPPPYYTTLVQRSWCSISRYVTPASPAEIIAGGANFDPYVDIPEAKEQDLVPAIQQLADAAWTDIRRYEQVKWTRNTVDWHFDFAFWLVEGGDGSLPAPLSTAPKCPSVPAIEENIYTLAVFELGGGPIGDDHAWNIQAWDLVTKRPMGGTFFNVTTDPSLNNDANSGLVNTELQAQIVEALTPAGFPGSYDFKGWTIGNELPQSGPLKTTLANPPRTLNCPRGTSGKAKAWYMLSGVYTPPPPWHDRQLPYLKRWILRPPPPPHPHWEAVQQQFDLATTMAIMAEGLSPELRQGALELAARQAALAAASLKQPFNGQEGSALAKGR